MPIYEFYCSHCNTVYSFFSKAINTKKVPSCPKCPNGKLSRQVSLFSISGRTPESGAFDDAGFDEAKMEKALAVLGNQAEKIDEKDPRQAADLMRKLTDMTGTKLGGGMEEALARLEKGGDPDAIEAELGPALESEEPFLFPSKRGGTSRGSVQAPNRDDTLYDL